MEKFIIGDRVIDPSGCEGEVVAVWSYAKIWVRYGEIEVCHKGGNLKLTKNTVVLKLLKELE